MPLPLTLGPSRALLLSPVAPPFTPASLPSLVLWLRADQGLYQDSAGTTLAAADADPVGRWSDLSGAGHNATQATGSKAPTLKLALQNGQPVVRFDGVDDALAASVAGTTAATLLVAFTKRAAPGGATAVPLSFQGVGNAELQTNSGVSPTRWYWHVNQAAGNTLTTITAAAWQVLTLALASASSLTVYGNGTSNVTLDPEDTLTTYTTLVLGARVATGVAPSDVDIAEIIVCSQALSTTQRQATERYLGTRYGITVA